jgi:hypothetical protein
LSFGAMAHTAQKLQLGHETKLKEGGPAGNSQ